MITDRNKEHNHRASKQNGYIKMITDKKQYDRIQIKWGEKSAEKDEKLQTNGHDGVLYLP